MKASVAPIHLKLFSFQ